MFIKVKKLNGKAKLPERATATSAGADLCACIDDDVVLMPGDRKLIPTGLSLANCVGVIDSDYRGEVKISVINHSDEPYTVKNGERIAQLVIMPVDLCEYGLCDELDDTERGMGGFGSTGRM